MTGLDKAREANDKLKAEKIKAAAIGEKDMEAIKNQLATLRNNSELSQMYAESAQIGSENLGGSLPLLKVHHVGKSSTNELADGSEPENGAFFYKPTKEQFKTVKCHILTISKGFKSEGIEQKGQETKLTYNQLMGGLIVDDGEFKPFLMYFTGSKLQGLWKFAKEVAPYTRMKPGIPMFALTVNLTTDKQKNDYGYSWVVNFDIETEEGFPKLVMDPGEFQFLKDSVEQIEEQISNLIDSRSLETDTISGVATEIKPEPEVVGYAESADNVEPEIDDNEIPFS